MVGTNALLGVSAKQQVQVRIAQIVSSLVMIQSSADIGADVSQMIDMGMLKEENVSLTCEKCGQVSNPEEHDSTQWLECPFCGHLQGAQEQDFNSPLNTEIEQAEEEPVSMPDAAILDEAAKDLDLAERLEQILKELRWNDSNAEKGGLILASIWESGQFVAEKEYVRAIDKYGDTLKAELLDNKVKQRVMKEFIRLQIDNWQGPGLTSIPEIIIFKDQYGDLSVNVDDPLKNLIPVNKEKRIQVGDKKHKFSMKGSAFISLIQKRRKRLQAVAETLLEMRKAFFEKTNSGDAITVLKHDPLHQKDFAQKIGISESVFAKLCSKGVLVDTPHGVFSLKDFFALAAGRNRRGSVTKSKEKELIEQMVEARESRKEILRHLKDAGIEMTERNLRHYLKAYADLADD